MSKKKAKVKEDKSKQLSKKKRNAFYEKELARLQLELVKMQYWMKVHGKRLVLIFEGRDAAGKGGVIKRMTEPMEPRTVRVVALGKPSDREQTQWYFQRYVAHLPAAGEIVIFDRSWYNRAGVERVMGFCSDQQYWEFLRSAPEFERMLVRSGIMLVKYWLSVSVEEQERRFQARAKDPARRWKLSDMDIEARDRWVDYSKAKDIMMEYTDIPEARWHQVESENKKRARLNVIRHLLNLVPYEDIIPGAMELPKRASTKLNYKRPERNQHIIIPNHYEEQLGHDAYSDD